MMTAGTTIELSSIRQRNGFGILRKALLHLPPLLRNQD
jgi:hypothetical protein